MKLHLNSGQAGFTLTEIIVSFVIISVLSVVAGIGLVEISKGFAFSKRNAQLAQQGDAALSRMRKEFGTIKYVSAASDKSITFTRNSGETITISSKNINGQEWIVLNDNAQNPLIGPVTYFHLDYHDAYNSSSASYSPATSILEFAFKVAGPDQAALSFRDRVNLYRETGA